MILWIWIHTSIEKKCSMIYWILLPKAEEGFIELNQCQVNNSWLEATYYIYPWVHFNGHHNDCRKKLKSFLVYMNIILNALRDGWKMGTFVLNVVSLVHIFWKKVSKLCTKQFQKMNITLWVINHYVNGITLREQNLS